MPEDRERLLEHLKRGRCEEALGVPFESKASEIDGALMKLSHRFRKDPEVKQALNSAAARLKREASDKNLAADRWLSVGQWYLKKSRQKKKSVEYLELCVLARGNGRDCHWLGSGLVELGRPAEALPTLREAVKLRGEPIDHHWLGQCLLNLNRAREALPALIKAADGEGDTHDHHLLGIAYDKVGQTDKAAKHLRRSAELGGEARDWRNLGIFLLNNHREKEAVEPLERAMALGGDAETCSALAFALWTTDRKTEAVRRAREAVAKDPHKDDYQKQLAMFLMQTGEAEDAFELLGESDTAIGGWSPETMKTLASILRREQVSMPRPVVRIPSSSFPYSVSPKDRAIAWFAKNWGYFVLAALVIAFLLLT